MNLALLCLAAFFAGLVDSIAGGGGLIQLPALFLLLPPAASADVATVLGTNKLSSICGTGTALALYSRRVPIPWRSIVPAGFAAFVTSFLGARLVAGADTRWLKPVMWLLLAAVAVFVYSRKTLGERHAPRFQGKHELAAALAIGLVLGFYDGFFGPGMGSFLVFLFIGWLGFDFLCASASAKVVNFATNLAALAYFCPTGHVLYLYALPMGACNVLGSFVGTRLAILKGNAFVRVFFLGVVTLLILRFGWEVLRQPAR